MVYEFSEEDEKLWQESAHAPDNDLKDPGADVDLLVRVKVIISVYRNVFVGIDSTFENLYKLIWEVSHCSYKLKQEIISFEWHYLPRSQTW